MRMMPMETVRSAVEKAVQSAPLLGESAQKVLNELLLGRAPNPGVERGGDSLERLLKVGARGHISDAVSVERFFDFGVDGGQARAGEAGGVFGNAADVADSQADQL